MKSMWAVVPVSYEYNDEIYHTGEGDSLGKPEVLFKTRQAAEEEAKIRSRKAAREAYSWPGGYGYGFDEITSLDIQQVNTIIAKAGGEPVQEEDSYENQLPKNATDALVDAYLKVFDMVGFYQVIEVPIG